MAHKTNAVDDVIVNSQLNAEQRNQVKDLLVEYKEVFSDVPKVTHLIEHKVELTESDTHTSIQNV